MKVKLHSCLPLLIGEKRLERLHKKDERVVAINEFKRKVMRRMFSVTAEVDGVEIECLADSVTGTLYDPHSGRCFTSSQLRLQKRAA